MLATLLLQTSALLSGPLYLEPEPPELRAVQHIVIPHAGVPGMPPDFHMDLDAARTAMGQLHHAITVEGASFQDLGRRVMRGRGLELGSYARGMLPDAMDAFLFDAEIGDVSEPLETPAGMQVLCRVPAWAGARTILLAGDDAAARADEVRRRLQAGEPFAEVAREMSDDREAAKRGGATQIFQRGASDRLVKAAAFEMENGVWRGPIESPLGLHFVQRVAPSELEGEAEYERTCIRLRALLVPWKGSLGDSATVAAGRTREAAFELAGELAQEWAAGARLEDLARRTNEDPGTGVVAEEADPLGRVRAGDLGWVHRRNPRLPDWTATLFSRPVGWKSQAPLITSQGYVLIERIG